MNTGIAIGGPINGREISSITQKVSIPVKIGPDRGEGDRGFGSVSYRWESFSGSWIFEDKLQ